MSQTNEALLAFASRMNEAIGSINSNITGVAGDVAALKEEVGDKVPQETLDKFDGIATKFEGIASALKALDDSTPANEAPAAENTDGDAANTTADGEVQP